MTRTVTGYSPPPDQTARENALDCTRSFSVSAPAGSGKTELLIQRTLKLLSRAESPESVLAITFTRKAANEMRERLIQALLDAQTNSPISGPHQQLTRDLALAALAQNDAKKWALIENPYRLQIQTIDAFCRRIADQLCLDTCVSIPPSIAEKPEQLYLNAAESILKLFDSDSEISAHLVSLFDHFDGNVSEVVQLFADMLASRHSWLDLVYNPQIADADYLENILYQIAEDRITPLYEKLNRYASDIEELLDYALQNAAHNPDSATFLRADLSPNFPEPTSDCLPEWRALISFLCRGDLKGFRKSVDKRSGFPKSEDSVAPDLAKLRKGEFSSLTKELSEIEDLLVLIMRVQSLPDVSPDAEHLEKSRSLLAVLPVLAASLNVEIQKSGETDYTDITITALQALERDGLPTSLALRLDYQINHILVDEFQDTSNLQVRLLERLVSGWQPDEDRTLFIVGDGMQSIYSFRKANVSLFVRARQRGIGAVALEPLNLTANFRSDAQIVDWVNTTFSKIFQPDDNLALGQVGFREAVSTRAPSAEPVYTLSFNSDIAEAEGIADEISRRLAKMGQAEDKPETIALLIRTRSHVKDILPALRARNIAWQAKDLDPLNGRMSVIDIHSLTRALCVPADRIAWLSILRAPWAGLDNADLLYLAQTSSSVDESRRSKPLSIWEAMCQSRSNEFISPDGHKILNRIGELIGSKLDQLGQRPLRELVEELWYELDGPASLINANELQDVEDYLDLVEQKEVAGLVQDWPAFDVQLESLYAKPRAADNDDAHKASVEIMTLHAAKGLEFDHVYMPGLNRPPRSDSSPLLLYAEPETDAGPLGYLASAKPAAGEEDDIYRYLKFERDRRSNEEASRLLYVGCTRAKKTLTLSCQLKVEDDGTIAKAKSGTLAKHLWGSCAESFESNITTIDIMESDEVPVLSSLRRLPVDRPSSASNSQFDTAECKSADALHSLPDLSTFLSNRRQRVLGNILHETLMEIVHKENIDPQIAEFESRWRKGLVSNGYQSEELGPPIDKLKSALETMLNDELGQWILSPKHTDSHAELEVDFTDKDGTLQRAIIDRTFIDNDIRWIIDYKSSQPLESETTEEFLIRESEQYRPQLSRYARLFEESTSINAVRAMLYFPVAGLRTEVEIFG